MGVRFSLSEKSIAFVRHLLTCRNIDVLDSLINPSMQEDNRVSVNRLGRNKRLSITSERIVFETTRVARREGSEAIGIERDRKSVV